LWTEMRPTKTIISFTKPHLVFLCFTGTCVVFFRISSFILVVLYLLYECSERIRLLYCCTTVVNNITLNVKSSGNNDFYLSKCTNFHMQSERWNTTRCWGKLDRFLLFINGQVYSKDRKQLIISLFQYSSS
jgi:hypothetical protein